MQLAAWMSAAADGDRAALDQLYAALWPVMSRYASRIVGDAALGEDVAQDALVALFGHLDDYDRDRDALTWALAHATWSARTARRKVGRRAEHDLDDAPEVAVPPAVWDRDLVRAALDTLASLPPRDVEVITAALTDKWPELRRAPARPRHVPQAPRARARAATHRMEVSS